MNKKSGIYICSGCKIGESLDTENIKNTIISEFSPKICVCNEYLCSNSSIENIKTNILENDLESVLIAGCSPRFNYDVFQFGENVITERVNLREQVAWCHKANDEDTQMLAEDVIRMGIAAIETKKIPSPFISEDISDKVLVIGAGISGITAAKEGAKAGRNIVLIEKEKQLGGYCNQHFMEIPFDNPSSKPVEPIINKEIEEIKTFKNIQVLTSTLIESIKGLGIFLVSIAAIPILITSSASICVSSSFAL